ncbi:hypothetical protein LMG9585_06200 [Xanthomonas oryzae pv. oryzae]|nr:hypothetical protein LMG9585_06200 [Xanthomonas oryzae pv. oryzae]
MAVPSTVAAVKLTPPARPRRLAGWLRLRLSVNTTLPVPVLPSAWLTSPSVAIGWPPPLHRRAALAALRGAGASVAQSAALLSVSVHPSLPRSTARVLLGAGVGALPSAQLAVLP